MRWPDKKRRCEKMARNGKIAKLPKELRAELNKRLDDNQAGPKLLDWLNARPETQRLVEQQFGAEPVNATNLSQWRRGGCADWRARREAVELEMELAGEEDEEGGTSSPSFAIKLNEWCAIQLAGAILAAEDAAEQAAEGTDE